MIKSITFRCILFSIIALLLSTKAQAQSNDYFSHGESWAGFDVWMYYATSFYVEQKGDTIVNNDTLIKLNSVHRDYSWNNHRDYLLAKSDAGKLYLYRTSTNYQQITDTIIIDYSRTDSVTYTRVNHSYRAEEIHSIDTVYFDGIPKKLFRLYDGFGLSDDDFVY